MSHVVAFFFCQPHFFADFPLCVLSECWSVRSKLHVGNKNNNGFILYFARFALSLQRYF